MLGVPVGGARCGRGWRPSVRPGGLGGRGDHGAVGRVRVVRGPNHPARPARQHAALDRLPRGPCRGRTACWGRAPSSATGSIRTHPPSARGRQRPAPTSWPTRTTPGAPVWPAMLPRSSVTPAGPPNAMPSPTGSDGSTWARWGEHAITTQTGCAVALQFGLVPDGGAGSGRGGARAARARRRRSGGDRLPRDAAHPARARRLPATSTRRT